MRKAHKAQESPSPGAASAVAVVRILQEYYGPPTSNQGGNAGVDELVQTILSQNTSDLNAERAYASLVARFGAWEEVVRAPVAEIADAIRAGGLAQVKAPRIRQVLSRILADRGEISLEFLRELDVARARTYLTSLPGVGPKTAACVLLFALGKPAIPVDTHVHRVARRLGLIGPRTSAEEAETLLEQQLPAEQYYAFHRLLIRHGRETCKALRPLCGECPLAALCPRQGLSEAKLGTGPSSHSGS